MITLAHQFRTMLAFALGTIGLCVSGGCTPNPSSQTASSPQPTASLPLPTPSADGTYHVTSEALFAPYRVDKKAADQFLRGKTVVVSGNVAVEMSDIEVNKNRVAAGGGANPDLFLYVNHPSNGFWSSTDGIVCNFPDSDRPLLRKFIKKIRREDRVFIRGTVGTKFGHIFLENCTLEKIESPEGDPSPAVALLPSGSSAPRSQRDDPK